MTSTQQMLMSLGTNFPVRTLDRILPLDTRYTYTNTGYYQMSGGSTTESTGNNYATFWSAQGDYNNTANDFNIRLDESATGIIFYNVEPKDTADVYSYGGVYGYAGGSSSKLFGIGFGCEVAGDTAGAQSFNVNVLKLGTNDVYSTSLGTSSTISSTMQTKCSVTIPKTGWYLIVASASVNSSITTGSIPAVAIRTNSVNYHGITSGYRKDTTNYVPYTASTTLNLSQSATLTLSYSSDGTNTVSIKEASLVCIYIGTSTSTPSDVQRYYYNESTSTTGITSTSFTTKDTGVYSIANPSNYHLLVASAQVSINTTTFSNYARFYNSSTATSYTNSDFIIEPPVGDGTTATHYYTLFLTKVLTFTQASNTMGWEWRSEDVTATAYMRNAHHAIIDLGFGP